MNIRKVIYEDLKSILHLLHDDTLGNTREEIKVYDYKSAFIELLENDYFDIFVMEQKGDIIGCYQIMSLPHLSFKGFSRAQIESVRIRSDMCGQGFGTQLIRHSIEKWRERGCGSLQLTNNKERTEANKFYGKLGLIASHDGYKFFY